MPDRRKLQIAQLPDYQISKSSMATHSATLQPIAPTSVGVTLPAFTLWWRESCDSTGSARGWLASFFSASVLDCHRLWLRNIVRSGQAAGQGHYLNYFYPGTLVMIVLFTAISQ